MRRGLAGSLAGLVTAGLVCTGCVGSTARRAERPSHEFPAGVTSLRWRTTVHQHGLFEPRRVFVQSLEE